MDTISQESHEEAETSSKPGDKQITLKLHHHLSESEGSFPITTSPQSVTVDREVETTSQRVAGAEKGGNSTLEIGVGLLHGTSHVKESIGNKSEDELRRIIRLGMCCETRYKTSGDVTDIDQSIAYKYQAVLLTPDGHADKPARLCNLGISYQCRFEHLGELVDIDKSIEYGSQAISLTPDGHVNKPVIFNNLGNSYRYRFEHLGKLVDIDKAIEYGSQAVLFTPDGDVGKPGRLNNLGNSYACRFRHLGELVDIDKAIECGSQAVLLTPDGHADKPIMLDTFGMLYQRRFEHLGELADIEQSIAYRSQAVLLIPDDHEDKPERLDNLGISYACRFGRFGELVDIDRAIECGSQAVLLTPDGRADKPGRLDNLGISYACRFGQLDELVDIDRAIAYHSQAVLLTPDGHAEKPAMLSNLGISYQWRFEHLGRLADIEQSIEYKSQAVLLTPDDHAYKPQRLSDLGNSYQCRFEHLGELADIDMAIEYSSQAALLTPDGHVDKPARLGNLGSSYDARFQHLHELADIEKAIAYHSQAVLLAPEGYPSKPTWLAKLGRSYLSRYFTLRESSDLRLSTSSLQSAAESEAGLPETRLWAAGLLAPIISCFDSRASLLSYQLTIELIPKVVWIGSTISRRYDSLQRVGKVAIEAAASAISADEYTLALEWLEAGRLVVWNQTLQLRTPFDDLSLHAPELAERLKEAAQNLEHASLQPAEVAAPMKDAQTLEAAAQKRRRLAEDFDDLLNQARQLAGFHKLLRPKSATELLAAAQTGPIIVINVDATRCDALILRPNNAQVGHVPLPDASHTELIELQRAILEVLESHGIGGRRPHWIENRPADPFEDILVLLWHKIVHPVLCFLGYTEKLPIEELPHITWCTTGPLSFLPIHAAGCYDEDGNNLFNFAVSSYIPNLSVLLPSVSQSYELGSLLSVSQEATPGCRPLPGTKTELACIQPHATSISYMQLENERATTQAVLDAMGNYTSVHLACHGSQNMCQPTESCFYLHDGSLTLIEIAKRSFKNKGLAFLSACQTASGHQKLPDEAIHLAAGMLVAGYPTVIATMWSIDDDDAPLIADKVYGQLAKDGKLSEGRAARALHAAVGALRAKVGEEKFIRWVPYVHMGV